MPALLRADGSTSGGPGDRGGKGRQAPPEPLAGVLGDRCAATAMAEPLLGHMLLLPAGPLSMAPYQL